MRQPTTNRSLDTARRMAVALGIGLGLLGFSARPAAAQAPPRLADTGLYRDFAGRAIAPAIFAYTPQYPLWSDGATKRRWILLPAESSIDASDPGAWVFPVGTKFWKEFSFGRAVETRYMERTAGGWIFATYRWSEDGSDAVLAPEQGVRGAAEIRPGVRHDLPSRWDCGACHEGQPTPVLGFSALQLSTDRDPLAPNAETPRPGDLDLAKLIERGLVRGLPAEWKKTPPRIIARSPRERAALGYLAANCAHCHNAVGPLANVGMSLAVRLVASHQSREALTTAVGQPSRYRLPGGKDTLRVAAGDPDHSLLALRMASREPLLQMPPLGTKVADQEALDLIRAWIQEREPAAEVLIAFQSVKI